MDRIEAKILVVLITAPSREVAKRIAEKLIEEKLAACVNLIPGISSLYTWEGQLCDEEEALLLVKTREDLFEDRLIPAVQAIHPYEVPEIIALPVVMGLKSYLDWVQAETA